MEREIIRKIIIEGQEFVNEIPLIKRPFFFEKNGNYVFVGIRQAGKSYLLYQRIQQLIEEGHSIEEMVYINFDDERLRQFTTHDFDLILQAYASMFNLRPILFFDEIQNIEGWENFARRLANQKYNVYIKAAFRKAGLTRMVTTIDQRTRQNVQVPICDLASSHMARRTFIGNVYKRVKDPAIVGAMSGHKDGSRAFARYRDIDMDIKRDAVSVLE